MTEMPENMISLVNRLFYGEIEKASSLTIGNNDQGTTIY